MKNNQIAVRGENLYTCWTWTGNMQLPDFALPNCW